jgi:hypothetical protein
MQIKMKMLTTLRILVMRMSFMAWKSMLAKMLIKALLKKVIMLEQVQEEV